MYIMGINSVYHESWTLDKLLAFPREVLLKMYAL